jgi:hypothetical protein
MSEPVYVKAKNVIDVLNYLRENTTTRAEGMAVLLCAYVEVAENFEPPMSREDAAKHAAAGILTMDWDHPGRPN